MDKIQLKGHFVLKMLNKDNKVIDKIEDKNLIMDLSREQMARLLGGVNNSNIIDKLVLGTKGHKGDDILTPKQVGEDGFTSDRTQLFSEETGDFHYIVPFDVRSDELITTVNVTNAYPSTDNTKQENVTVERNVDNRFVKYTFNVPAESANKGDGTAVAYTEAALYAGTSIFSMKCFSAKVKDETEAMEIEWTIIF